MRGGHIVLTSLVKKMREDGYDVNLVTFDSEKNAKKEVPCWKGVEFDFIKVDHKGDFNEEQIAHVEAVAEYLEKNIEKFDKVILDSWFVALACARKNIFSDKIYHLVQSDPCFVPENKMEFWKSELFNLLPVMPFNRIVVGKSLAEHFEDKYEREFKYIKLFLDKAYLNAQFEVKERNLLRIVSSSATFNIKSKGLKFLLDKLDKFDEFDFELTLITSDTINENLDNYSFPIKTVNAKNSEEMIRELCKNDIYVNTSTQEAFGLALAEAMAIGMPAIALDSVGNREYMDGENAIFVEDFNNFSEELKKMKNFEFRKNLSESAKKSMQEYTLENTINELKNVMNI